MSESGRADDLSDYEETNIDEVEDEPDEASELVATAHAHTGYSSEEFEEDEGGSERSSTSAPTSTSPPAGHEDEEEEDSSRHSPFVPENSVTPPPSSRRARAPPLYTANAALTQPEAERRDPPPYTRTSRAAGIELQDVATGTLPHASRPPGAQPPSYDAAVARNVARQAETTFGEDVETHYTTTVDSAPQNVPPPQYDDIDRRRRSLEPAVESTDDDVEGRATPERRASTSSNVSGGFFQQVMHSIRNRERLRGSTRRTIIITSVVLFCLLMFVILFPFQFSYVDYYQYAMVKRKSTGVVDTDRVYEHGCYVLGADREFVYLDRYIHSIEFTQLSMFTKDNVDLSIDVKLYYYLKYDYIGQLWRDYAGKYEDVIVSAARTTIRNCAARASQDDYLLRREYVEQLIHEALKEKFSDWGIDVAHFYYSNLHLPSRILDLKLKLLLIRTDVEKEHAYQLQRQVELETELLTTPVIYLAKEAINNGTAQAAAIHTVSSTEKNKYVDVAHMNAFDSMMNVLNVTQMDHALSFYYLATLNTMDHFAGAVDYSKLGHYAPSNT